MDLPSRRGRKAVLRQPYHGCDTVARAGRLDGCLALPTVLDRRIPDREGNSIGPVTVHYPTVQYPLESRVGTVRYRRPDTGLRWNNSQGPFDDRGRLAAARVLLGAGIPGGRLGGDRDAEIHAKKSISLVLVRMGNRELRAVKIPASYDAWRRPKRRKNDSEKIDLPWVSHISFL